MTKRLCLSLVLFFHAVVSSGRIHAQFYAESAVAIQSADGKHVVGSCTSSVVQTDPPSPGFGAGGNTYAMYPGVSATCTLTVGSTPYTCGASFPDYAQVTTQYTDGSGNLIPVNTSGYGAVNEPASECQIIVPVQPGVVFSLNSEHYLWLPPQQSAVGMKPARSHLVYAAYDPQPRRVGFRQSSTTNWCDVQNFTQAQPQNYTDIASETGGVLPWLYDAVYGDTTADEGTIKIFNTNAVPFDGPCSQAQFLNIANTQAEMLGLTLNPSMPTSFVPQQQILFSTNAYQLGAFYEENNYTVNWCIQPSITGCHQSPPGSPFVAALASFLSSPSTPTYIAGGGGDQTLVGTAASLNAQTQYVCATDTYYKNNFACSPITPVVLTQSPFPSSPTNLTPGQQFSFMGSVNTSLQVDWSWSLAVSEDGSCGSGSPGSSTGSTGQPAGAQQSSFNYIAPQASSAPCTDTLGVKAMVQGPGSVITLPGNWNIDITSSAGSSSQTVSFTPISQQLVGNAISLAATSSSGLPVSFITSSPNICIVNGSTALMTGAGTCVISAIQPGSSSYKAASAAQSFAVGHYETASLGSISVTSTPQAIGGPPYDTGSVTITINGFPETVTYGQFSTTASIASAIAAYFSGKYSSPVVAKAAGPTVAFYPRSSSTTGMTVSSSIIYDSADYPHPSFGISQ